MKKFTIVSQVGLLSLVVVVLLALLPALSPMAETSPLCSPLPTPSSCGPLSCEDAAEQADCRVECLTVMVLRHPDGALDYVYDCDRGCMDCVTPTPAPTPDTGNWWRIDDWMGEYPLWTNGTLYCVEIDGQVCP